MAVINASYIHILRTMHIVGIVIVLVLIISTIETKELQQVLLANGDGEIFKIEYPQEIEEGKNISDSINTSVVQLVDDSLLTNNMDALNMSEDIGNDILTSLINKTITYEPVLDTSTGSSSYRTTTTGPTSSNPMKRMVVLLCLSMIIPAVFMMLLLWRLRKEKKRMNQNVGALIYRETIIVPAYTIENTIANGTVANMHHALYDAPPEYDTAIRTKQEIKEIHQVDIDDDISPPPTYSDAVHM